MHVKILGPTANKVHFQCELDSFVWEHGDRIKDIKYSFSTIYPGENMHFYSAMIIYEKCD